MAPKAEDSTPSKGRAKLVPKPAPAYELLVPDLRALGSYAFPSVSLPPLLLVHQERNANVLWLFVAC